MPANLEYPALLIISLFMIFAGVYCAWLLAPKLLSSRRSSSSNRKRQAIILYSLMAFAALIFADQLTGLSARLLFKSHQSIGPNIADRAPAFEELRKNNLSDLNSDAPNNRPSLKELSPNMEVDDTITAAQPDNPDEKIEYSQFLYYHFRFFAIILVFSFTFCLALFTDRKFIDTIKIGNKVNQPTGGRQGLRRSGALTASPVMERLKMPSVPSSHALSTKKAANRGQRFYRQIESELMKKYDGQHCFINTDTGEYVVAKTGFEAYEMFIEKFGENAPIWGKWIGRSTII